MRNYLSVALAAFVLAACGNAGNVGDNAAPTTADAQPPWEEFVATAVSGYYERRPERAVDAGLHQYDGQMNDYSADALRAYGEWLDGVVAAATAYAELDGIQAFERDYLVTAMNSELFDLRDTDDLTKNPYFYVRFDVSVYADREYAPLADRLRAYTRYIEQVPARMQAMRKNLQPPLPAPLLDIAYGVASGFADYLESTVPTLFADATDTQLQRQFVAARTAGGSPARSPGPGGASSRSSGSTCRP